MKKVFLVCLQIVFLLNQLVGNIVFANEINKDLDLYEISNKLKPFYTDGCTLFIDGPPFKPRLWRHCCVEHDLRFWFGGDHEDLNDANLRLASCVKDVAGDFWAQVIFRGVRVGKYSPIKHKTHWAWGWENPRHKDKLTQNEIIYVLDQLRKTSVNPEIIEDFIRRNFPGY